LNYSPTDLPRLLSNLAENNTEGKLINF